MPTCPECKNQVEEVTTVRVGRRKRRICEDCVERLEEEGLIAEESESVVRNMMGFKGRR